jgi:hypothetical protein
MSHHFDWSRESQDISDVHCFAGPSDADGPRTVIGMNVSPSGNGHNPSQPGSPPWDLGTGPNATLYELKLDRNDDFVEDITWRFTFSDPDSTGEPQYVQVAQLTGADATSRTAPGTIITPPNAPVGEVLTVGDGIKIFAGERLDSFFTDIRVPARMRNVLPPDAAVHYHADPDLHGLAPFNNTFAGHPVRLVMVELPATITGLDPIQCWGSTAIFDTTHTPNSWVQVQRAAGADTAVVFDNGTIALPDGTLEYVGIINSTGPSADLAGRPANPATDPATGVWGMVRDQVATVVEAMGTYSKGTNGQPTPRAYGAWVADTLLPNVLRFTPGTTALWDPWNGVKNGKGLHEELASNFARMVTNTGFTTHLTQQGPLLDYFPYLAPPLPGS